MSVTRIFIGPFQRRLFADGLRAALEEDPTLSVTSLLETADIRRHLAAETPTVLILEQDSEGETAHPLPLSPSVAVILISSEGKDAQIALRHLDRTRLRDAIGLAEQSAHPKVISLSAARPAQPPLVLPTFRHEGRSALASVLAWLDAAFALALNGMVTERGGDTGGWGGDLSRLLTQMTDGAEVTPEEEARRFEAMLETPFWQQRFFQTFALEPEEFRAICIGAAPDLDQRFGAAIGLLQNNYAEPRPNASTLAAMTGTPELVGADVTAFLGGRRLLARYGLIRPVPMPAERQGEPQVGYRVAPAVLELILGQHRRAGVGWRLQTAALPALPSLAESLATTFDTLDEPVFTVSPEEDDAAEEMASALLAIGRPVLRADARALATSDDMQDLALRARLLDAVLQIEGLEGATAEAAKLCFKTDLSGLTPGLVLVGGYGLPSGVRPVIPVRIGRPTSEDRIRRWAGAMRDHGVEANDAVAQGLSARLRFRLADIDGVAQLASGRLRAGAESDAETAMLDAAHQVSVRHAPSTVRRPPCVFDWSDIVLPESIASQVQAVPTHVLNGPLVLDDWGYSLRLSYGRGVGALFSGPSGTGKTMSAQVIAKALGVDLMQVELSRCVSKYIGETEKNIDKCFEAAEASSALLLFDEADAIFGKRTEIKDSHDRHANVEVAYLLQRIEAYEGLVILTTNLKANIDTAFLRRLRFVIDFPMPNAAEREAIWTQAIPTSAPCAPDVDVAFLARRLELSGGSIQQIAVNAAFAAASDSGVIEMQHIMTATRAELIKMGMFTAERGLPEPEAGKLIGRQGP